MPNDPAQLGTTSRGFTLLETLVALGITSVLLATLIPISRNTLFRIIALSQEAKSLPVLESSILGTRDVIQTGTQTKDTLSIKITKQALAPFDYDRSVKDRWHPVLVRIETSGQTGENSFVELIRLERDAP